MESRTNSSGGGGANGSLALEMNNSNNIGGSTSSLNSKELRQQKEDVTLYFKKISSALFYGLSSFMITVVNKTVLTSYRFPSFLFLSMGQLTASIVVLSIGKRLKLVNYPPLQRNTFKKIFPLPLIFLGNMMFGLGGTQALSLPMFAALRRFSILMTMLLELRILGIRPSVAVQVSVYGMISGALLAASDDLSFNMQGYTFVMITNALTAANGVFVKKKLDTADIGKYGLMFYNSLFMFAPALLITYLTGDLDQSLAFNNWHNPYFFIQFLLSCFMGFILSYSTILCTQYNSALTTTIVGCLKNICVTYLGMFIGGDYIFSWLNCIGINISVFASLLYTYVTFRRKQAPDKELLIPTTNKSELCNKMLQNICKRSYLLAVPQRYVKQIATIATSNTVEEINANVNIDESVKQHWDDFTKEFMQNRIEMSPFQKGFLAIGSSIAALVDPKRHDMIACLGETTGEQALQNILYSMKNCDEGQRILQHKPRINTRTVDIEKLRQLPENTLGRVYVKFLDDNQVTPDSRMEVRFMVDPELAYIMTRYRECHDLVHAILDMPTNMLGEVTVKWFEALNNGLPMCYGGAIFGAIRLRPKQRKLYKTEYLPWAIKNGKHAKPLMPVYWEERWEQDIDEIRKELQITKLK
ncbi:UDP-sugar transporter UST74c-like [Cochliomyia hominivorax]